MVLDEAANLYQSNNYRLARPSRISWLMTGLINQGASVALLVTPQFFNTQADYVDKSGWAAAQFLGRIEKYVALPDILSLADLEKSRAGVFAAWRSAQYRSFGRRGQPIAKALGRDSSRGQAGNLFCPSRWTGNAGLAGHSARRENGRAAR